MPRVSLVGDGHGGSEDYATLALWWAAESIIDYGSPIEAQLKGWAGRNQSISGSSVNGAIAYTKDVEYDGTNHLDLAYFTGVTLNSTTTFILKHFRTRISNGYDTPLNVGSSSLNATVEYFYAERDRLVSNYPTLRIDAASLTNTVRTGVVNAANNGTAIDHKYDDRGTLSSLLVFGSLGKGVSGSNVDSFINDSFSFDNVSDDFDSSMVKNNCASEDLTGDITGYTSAELMDFASGDYRVKTSSALHGLGVGAFFEQAATLTQVETNHQILSSLTGKVNADFQTIINALSSVNKSQQVLFELLQQVNKSHDGNFDCNELVNTNFTVLTDLRYRELLSQQFVVKFLGRKTTDFQSVIDLLSQKETNFATQFDLYHKVNKAFEYNCDFLSQNSVVSAQTLVFDLKERLTQSFTHDLTLLQASTSNFAIVDDLLSAVSTQLTNQFNLTQSVNTNVVISLDYIARKNTVYDVVFSVQGDEAEKTPIHFIVDTSNVLQFGNSADILYFNSTKVDPLQFS